LRNHAPDIAAMDLFLVPTIGFDLRIQVPLLHGQQLIGQLSIHASVPRSYKLGN
jgi:hypothetical protein